MDLYRLFEKDSVSSIVDAMLDGAVDDLEEEPNVNETNKLQGLSRSAALYTESDLNSLVTFLQMLNSNATTRDDSAGGDALIVPSFDCKQLSELLSQLPTSITSANKVPNNVSPETPIKRVSSASLLGKGILAL